MGNRFELSTRKTRPLGQDLTRYIYTHKTLDYYLCVYIIQLMDSAQRATGASRDQGLELKMSKPTVEATNVVIQSVALLQAASNGQHIADLTNIFGEVESQETQIENAKLTIRRFAEVYCQ